MDCQDFLQRLCAGRITAGVTADADSQDLEGIRLLLSNSYRLVNLADPQNHPSLAADGVSTEFLKIAEKGNWSVFHSFKQWASSRLGKQLDGPECSPRVVDALVILNESRKYSISPWTGLAIPTVNSVALGWFLFPHTDDGFLVGQVAEWAVQSHDSVWVIPKLKKILYIDTGVKAPELLRQLARVVANLTRRLPSLVRYLSSSDRQVVICDWPCDHFGHYVWNIISAWGSLLELSNNVGMRKILCFNPELYFGRIVDIFKINENEVTEIDGLDENSLLNSMFCEGWLLSSITAHHISSYSADCVVRHSMALCESDFKQRLVSFTKDHWPVILLSLRFDNRSWVDQIDGFTDFATKIRADYPQAGFFIHGMSKGVSRGATTAWMSLEVEMDAAALLERALGGPVNAISAVGLSIHESVAISFYCDTFAAPLGSGMALYKWLTNKPGVAFSNRTCLDVSNPDRWALTVFDHSRSGIIPANYVPITAITDVEATGRGSALRANFTMNRDALYETLKRQIGLLNRRRIPVIVYCAPR